MANVISCIRVLCGIGLLFCAPFSQWFYLLYILGGVSDVLDGFAARMLHTQSKLGAKLDTAADFVFAAALLIKVLYAVTVPLWLILWVIGIAVIKCINVISGVRRTGHFVAEHTVLNKICGVLLFALPFCIGSFSGRTARAWIILTCAGATAASLQEGCYIRMGKEID